MNRDVMFDWIAGFTGDNQSSSETSARIKRTIIAGNTFKFDAPEERWDGEVKRVKTFFNLKTYFVHFLRNG